MRLCKKEDFLSIKYGKNKLPNLHSSVENPPPSRYNRACIIGKYQASGREETPLA